MQPNVFHSVSVPTDERIEICLELMAIQVSRCRIVTVTSCIKIIREPLSVLSYPVNIRV